MAIIELQNVDFSYKAYDADSESVAVLKDFSLKIERGSFTAVLGRNGSGKSTVAKLTNGIIFPDKGKVLIDGAETKDDDSVFDIRRKIGMVFQNPDNQIVASVVEEDVAFGVENLGYSPQECRRRVDRALKTVGMYEYRAKAPHKLSGGQKQRVAVAGIIAMKPECIVLDEPTAMLDPAGRREVINTVKKLNRDENITIVLITHYMAEAAQADRVIVIDNGKIELDGTPRQVFSSVDKIKEIGLDVPQSTELLHRCNIKTDETVLCSDECVDVILEKLKSAEGA
ncbi:MAG: energy-coupling factor transporter ATPase [Clostridiales bacterium]|nr:energy-coupling factor transporter ATPase [Clostridiales bacterium]